MFLAFRLWMEICFSPTLDGKCWETGVVCFTALVSEAEGDLTNSVSLGTLKVLTLVAKTSAVAEYYWMEALTHSKEGHTRVKTPKDERGLDR